MSKQSQASIDPRSCTVGNRGEPQGGGAKEIRAKAGYDLDRGTVDMADR